MEIQEMNSALMLVLHEWDPFDMGSGNYEPEIADVVFAVSEAEDVSELAGKIKAIYEFSFEEKIDLKEYLHVAEKLMIIRNNLSCSL